MILTKTSIEAAKAISQYLMIGMHHSTPDGQRSIAAIITQAQVNNPSKALRELAEKAIDGRCRNCGDRLRIEIET